MQYISGIYFQYFICQEYRNDTKQFKLENVNTVTRAQQKRAQLFVSFLQLSIQGYFSVLWLNFHFGVKGGNNLFHAFSLDKKGRFNHSSAFSTKGGNGLKSFMLPKLNYGWPDYEMISCFYV